MQGRFPRNSRQRSNGPRSGSGFHSARAPAQRGGASGVAGAKRQYERYLALAQAALLSGDTIEAQNCYQHAEHFFRVLSGQQT
jgi:uncharacterized protein DUF4167